MCIISYMLHWTNNRAISVEENRWPDVFSSQTHRLLRLSPDRRELSRTGPGASARIEHGRTVGHASGHGAVGSADAFGATLLRETGGPRCPRRWSDRTGPGATGRPGSGLWSLVGNLAAGSHSQGCA